MVGTVLIVFLVLALVGCATAMVAHRQWGYSSTGGSGAWVLIIVLVLLLLGRILRQAQALGTQLACKRTTMLGECRDFVRFLASRGGHHRSTIGGFITSCWSWGDCCRPDSVSSRDDL